MREGPQPPACALQSCDNPPVNGMVGYCPVHAAHYANGSAITPPIQEPDNPDLIEREAKKAAEQEAKEYAERRRVKAWRTLENGTRVPEEYWTDEELEAIEAEVEQSVRVSQARILEQRIADDPMMPLYRAERAVDPDKADLKLLRKALRGKLGPGAQKLVRALVEHLAIGD